MINETISHYRILDKLGEGGMGVVYLAEDVKLTRKVALKFLPDDISRDPAALERFLREARTAASLNHPNICTIYEVGEEKDRRFIAMELLEGQTLRMRIESGKVRLSDILEWSIQVTDGLDAAHQKGIIHRDIKPGNIFITQRGQAKVLDFGLAKIDTKKAPSGTGPAASMATMDEFQTNPGAAVGTVSYMSPEQALGEALDARTDLFSTGVVVYEMVTGQIPFKGNTSAAIFDAILHKAPVAPIRLNPELPMQLEEVINKALEKDPQLRYQSAAEFRTDLKRIRRDIESGRTSGVSTRATGVASAARQKKSPFLWLAAAAVVLLLAGGGYFWKSRIATSGHATQFHERQLTTNPVEDPIYTAAISPDGKYLAYADYSGLFLRMLATNETHKLEIPPGFCFK